MSQPQPMTDLCILIPWHSSHMKCRQFIGTLSIIPNALQGQIRSSHPHIITFKSLCSSSYLRTWHFPFLKPQTHGREPRGYGARCIYATAPYFSRRTARTPTVFGWTCCTRINDTYHLTQREELHLQCGTVVISTGSLERIQRKVREAD